MFSKPKTSTHIKPRTGFKKPVATELTEKNTKLWREDWSIPNKVFEFGAFHRFKQVYFNELKGLPLKFLIALKKRNPKVMVLGPGIGLDLIELKRYLERFEIDPEIDTFAITKALDVDAKKLTVTNEFAFNTPLELIDPKNPEHNAFVNHVTNRYDLVIAPLSVGFHTHYPAQNSFKSALMLTKGGEAFVQLEYVFGGETLIESAKKRKALKTLFGKLVNNHNKRNGTNLQFELEFVRPNIAMRMLSSTYQIYLRIKRVN